jgi:hypothetical protein
MVMTNTDTVRVVIITKDHRIEGQMHILAGSRITDALNSKAKDFYAITDASIFKSDTGALLATPEYVAVAREAMAAIFPSE